MNIKENIEPVIIPGYNNIATPVKKEKNAPYLMRQPY